MISKLIKLIEVDDNKEVLTGTTIRLYKVKRLDIMKRVVDQKNEDKNKMDFFEYLLVDTNALSDDTFLLINVTSDSNKRGEILCVLKNNKARGGLCAKILKDYFDGNEDVFVLSEELG